MPVLFHSLQPLSVSLLAFTPAFYPVWLFLLRFLSGFLLVPLGNPPVGTPPVPVLSARSFPRPDQSIAKQRSGNRIATKNPAVLVKTQQKQRKPKQPSQIARLLRQCSHFIPLPRKAANTPATMESAKYNSSACIRTSMFSPSTEIIYRIRTLRFAGNRLYRNKTGL